MTKLQCIRILKEVIRSFEYYRNGNDSVLCTFENQEFTYTIGKLANQALDRMIKDNYLKDEDCVSLDEDICNKLKRIRG